MQEVAKKKEALKADSGVPEKRRTTPERATLIKNNDKKGTPFGTPRFHAPGVAPNASVAVVSVIQVAFRVVVAYTAPSSRSMVHAAESRIDVTVRGLGSPGGECFCVGSVNNGDSSAV
jgi:hypothetical protein